MLSITQNGAIGSHEFSFQPWSLMRELALAGIQVTYRQSLALSTKTRYTAMQERDGCSSWYNRVAELK